MGAAQSIPIIGETVTVVQSGTKLAGAGVAGVIGGSVKLITGEDNVFSTAAGELAQGAGNSWVEYSERNMIAAPVRWAVHKLRGESQEADRISKKCVDSTESFLDNTPGVGHVKGAFHYFTGDTEHGDRCMKGATRSVTVVGAEALTGGAGAGAWLAAKAAGVGYDAIVTGIEYVVDDQPVVDDRKARDEYQDVNGIFDTGLEVMRDIEDTQ